MTHPSITVLATGVGGGGTGEGVVKALRLAKRYRIVTTDINVLSPTLYRSDAGYLVPRAEAAEYVARLLEICRIEKAQVVIPGSEPELERISRDRESFLESGVQPLLGPERTIATGQDKWLTYGFLREHGFDAPITALIETVSESTHFPYPAVVKPRAGSGGGSRHVFSVRSFQELQCAKTLLESYGLRGIVQQDLGHPEREYTVGVLISRDGGILSTVCLRRALMPGGASGRIITDEVPIVRYTAERICIALGVRGPANVQCRFDGEKVWTFELNVRFSGTTPVRAALGVNEPDMVIRDQVLRENVAPVEPRTGVAIMRGFQEVYTSTAAVEALRTRGCTGPVGVLENYF